MDNNALLLSALFFLLSCPFEILRLQVLLPSKFTFMDTFIIHYRSLAVSYVIPFSQSADIAKFVSLYKKNPQILQNITVVIVERALGILVLAILSLYGIALGNQDLMDQTRLLGSAFVDFFDSKAKHLALVLVSLIFVVTFFLATNYRYIIRKIKVAFTIQTGLTVTKISRSFCHTALFQLSRVLMFSTLLAGTGIDVTIPVISTIMLCALFGMLFPFSVAGLGVREATIVFAMGLFDVPIATAMAVALITRGYLILQATVGGFSFMK